MSESTTLAYRNFSDLLRERRGLMALGLLLVLVNKLAGMVAPGATKYLIDEVIMKRNFGLMLPIMMWVGGAAIVQAGTTFAMAQLVSVSATRFIAQIRIRVQRHLTWLPLRFYDSNKVGTLSSRVMSDVDAIRSLVGSAILEMIGGLATALIALTLLINLNLNLTIMTLAFVGLFFVMVRRALISVRPLFRERQRIRAEVSGRLNESLSGIRVVKGFHAEEREQKVFEEGAWRLFDINKVTILKNSILSLTTSLVMGLVSLSVVIVGGDLIVQGEMTVGDFVAYMLYLGMMVGPLMQISRFGNQWTEALAGLDRMHELMSEPREDMDTDRQVELTDVRGELRFEGVGFEYDPGKPVLKDVNLVAYPGTVTALVGSSGSGKSTLISLVAAFAKPVSGRITVDGQDLSTVTLASYRNRLGVVLQESFLFDGTLRENIRFGRPGATDADVESAAQVAHVDEFVPRLESGYETRIGERGVKLSGGQRQRVAIARAVLADPRILILDEATSNLDNESEMLIQEGLAELLKGRTTFVIAHRLSTIQRADQILVLEAGEIVERGTHEELMEHQGRYHDLYTRQSRLNSNRFVNPGERPEEETAPLAPGIEDRVVEAVFGVDTES